MFDECSDTTARRSPIRTPAQGRKDRHRLSGLLSGRGSAPPCDQARQPILPAIIVAAEPAIVNVAAQTLASRIIASLDGGDDNDDRQLALPIS